MAEVLTESFCERCGTRYTFESAQPRVKRLKGVKVLSRGLKNFVLSDDSSLDEAMAAARSDTERETTALQLDAFHQTFNFCMTCRQYTCANCWNEAEGACLTCAPHLGHEILPAPFPNLDPAAGLVPLDASVAANGNGNGHDHDLAPANGVAAASLGLGAWPTSDLATPEAEASSLEVIDDVEPIDAAARLAALTAVTPSEPAPAAVEAIEAVEVPEAADAVAPAEIEVAAAAIEAPAVAEVAAIADVPEAVVEPAPAAAETDQVAAAAAAQTAALLHRFRPGQNLDAEIEAYEREQAALEAGTSVAETPGAIEPIAAAALVADAPAAPAAEPISAEPIAAEPIAEQVAEPEPAAEPEQAVPAAADASTTDTDALAAAAALGAVAAQRTDVVEQPTWHIVAPDVEPAPTAPPPLTPPAQPASNGTEPQWPTHAQATSGLPFLGRPAQPTGGLESLWAESSREVASAPPAPGRPAQAGVQPCVSCGLSLSATARFCRRCGTSQVA